MRKSIKFILLFTVIVLVTFVLLDGTYLYESYLNKNDLYEDSSQVMTEVQFNLIKSGISAASSHNMQPWKITINDNQSFSLSMDYDKKLSVVDRNNTQLLISQGTFIGNVINNANQADIDLTIDYHPLNLSNDNPLIATFNIETLNDETYDIITQSTYTLKSESDIDIIKVVSDIQSKTDLTIEYHDSKLNRIKDLLSKANKIESENEDAMKELLSVFRFTRWDKNKYKYGLSLNTLNPILEPFVNPIMNLTKNWKSFGQSGISVFEERLSHEVGYIFITKKNPVYEDYIKTGEIVSQLSNNLSGYRVQPAVQILEELPQMESLKNMIHREFSQGKQILLIIGISPFEDSHYDSIRHKVDDLINIKY